MFTLPYFQIYSCLFDMQLSPFIWYQRKNKPWKFHVIMTKTPWLFLVSFFHFFSVLVFHIHLLRRLVPAECQYLFPLSKPAWLEEPTLPLCLSIWMEEVFITNFKLLTTEFALFLPFFRKTHKIRVQNLVQSYQIVFLFSPRLFKPRGINQT